jgi:hypothetical protein
MEAGSGLEAYKRGNTTDVGIIMVGESLQLPYANDQARIYIERAGMRSCRTNKIFASKLSIWELRSGSETPSDHAPILIGTRPGKPLQRTRGHFSCERCECWVAVSEPAHKS